MTPEELKRLEEIEARESKAQRGPWLMGYGRDDNDIITEHPRCGRIDSVDQVRHGGHPIAEEVMDGGDHWFICASREDIPYLTALVRRQAAQIETLRGLLEQHQWVVIAADGTKLFCACCERPHPHHTKNCPLKAALEG